MALEVINSEHMRKCVAFARTKDMLPQLLSQLWRLHTFGERGPDAPPECRNFILHDVPSWIGHGLGTVCRVFPDSAPASFSFSLSKIVAARQPGDLPPRLGEHRPGPQHWFSGGLIYHGDQSGWAMSDGRVIPPGYGVETFSVAFGVDVNANPWSIHT